MSKIVVYVHGKDGSASEAEHFRPLFQEYEVTGFDYHSETPWEARNEFPEYFGKLLERFDSVILIANSIGAYLSMCSLSGELIEQAYFISPIVDMEQLILDMLDWSGNTEEDLLRRKEIPTEFGETLSWDYLAYVRENPVNWQVPTKIIYGEKDYMTSLDTMTRFSDRTGAKLTVMPEGEHWFHTREQMQFLDRWIKGEIREN